MRKNIFAFLECFILIFIWSCSHLGNNKEAQEAENRVLQQNDGTISLVLDKAACYSDAVNPSDNTADWNVVISKPGGFKVWLSSATRDTSVLHYANSVRISLMDDQLQVKPACDKIVRNSTDVHYPYYRADSYMGSFYVPEPGVYNIQIISEKVIEKDTPVQNNTSASDTKLISVNLTPIVR
jgi:hypothetical protein